MSTLSKFEFGDAFEVDESGRVIDENEARPLFTDEDLASARGEGQQTGYETGRNQALAEIEAIAGQTLQAIAAELGQIGSLHQQVLLEINADAARLALAVAAKLAPALLERQPLAEVQALVERCLTEMPTEPRIVIRVAEALVDELQDGIDGVKSQSGFAGELVLIGEPAMTGGDCRVEWADGGAERNLAALQDRIEAAVDRYCAGVADHARRLAEAAANAAQAEVEAGEEAPAEAAPEPAPAAAEAEEDTDDLLESTLPELNRDPLPGESLDAGAEGAPGVQLQE